MGIEEFKPPTESNAKNDGKRESSTLEIDREMENEVSEIFSSKEHSIHLIKDEKKLAEKIGIPVLMLNVILVVIVLCFACLLFLGYAYYSTISITTYGEVVTKKNMTTEVKGIPKISYGKYFINPQIYDGRTITVKGSLGKKDTQKKTGLIYSYIIVDDLGNSITLEKADEYKILFPDAGLSTGIFQAKGTFKKGYEEIIIELEELLPTLKTEEVIESKTTEVSFTDMVGTPGTLVPKFPFMHNCACSKYDAPNPEINYRFRICICDKQQFIYDIADYDY